MKSNDITPSILVTTRHETVEVDLGAEPHAPELYFPGGEATGVPSLDAIGPAEIGRYREQGYLVVERAFTRDETADAIAGLVDMIMRSPPGFKSLQFEAKAQETLDRLNADQRQDAVRRLSHFVEIEPRLRALSHHAGLLGVVQQLLGDRAPALFQDMALIKPPRLDRGKPWHQDHAYFDYPLGTPIAGVWIALDEATAENGCMQILPGRHREGPIIHFRRCDWQICDDMILGTRSLAVPLKPGGLLFFDGLLPHGTPQNRSPRRRRALQFHYAPAGMRKSSTAERLAVFGPEGKNVQC